MNIIGPISLSSYFLSINSYRCNSWVKGHCPLTFRQQWVGGTTKALSPTLQRPNFKDLKCVYLYDQPITKESYKPCPSPKHSQAAEAFCNISIFLLHVQTTLNTN